GATTELYVERDGTTGSSTGASDGALGIIATSAPATGSGDSYDMDDMEAPMESADVVEAESRSMGEGGGFATTSDTLAYAPDPASVPVNTDPLRAGEIDDNAEWDDYQDYRNDFLDTYGTYGVRDVDTTGRQVIRVLDTDGNP